MVETPGRFFDDYFYVKCYFIVGVIALRHLPTLLNVDVDVEYPKCFQTYNMRQWQKGPTAFFACFSRKQSANQQKT